MVISMLKIRRPLGRLIFNMGIAIPGKTVFLIETSPSNRNITLLTTWSVWGNGQTYIDGLGASQHSNKHRHPNDAANRRFRTMIQTFIPMCGKRYKRQFILAFSFLAGTIVLTFDGVSFPRENYLAKWTWDSLVVSMHLTIIWSAKGAESCW